MALGREDEDLVRGLWEATLQFIRVSAAVPAGRSPVGFGCLNRRHGMQAQGREVPRFLRERFMDSSGGWNRYYFYTNFEIGSLGFFRHARTSTKQNRTAYCVGAQLYTVQQRYAIRCGRVHWLVSLASVATVHDRLVRGGWQIEQLPRVLPCPR
jgi:hypothetical protein